MADRFGYQFTQSLSPELFVNDGYATVGVSGALVPDQRLSLWVSSITRNSTGNYTVVLTDLWDSLSFISVQSISDNVATDYTTVKVVTFQAGSVALTSPYATTPASFVIQVSSAGSPADPPNNGGLQFLVLTHNVKASAQ